MFLELHDEKTIAYKHLTDVELGRKKNNNQTHIGLKQNVFTYLPNSCVIEDCILIYNNKVNFLPMYFDRIKNTDDTYRSPKIRKGEIGKVSITTFIRERANENGDDNVNWYLFWFGLKSGKPVFFLFNENSDTYKELRDLNIELPEKINKYIAERSPHYKVFLEYLEKILNNAGITTADELKAVIQTTSEVSKEKREYDINKGFDSFEEIGRDGESLIDRYFSKLKKNDEIANYKWLNEENESGLPYDFYYETKTGEIIYLDVKTTNLEFSQKIFFSDKEIKFAVLDAGRYHIYRLYVNENGERCMRICTNAKELFMDIYHKTNDYKKMLIEVSEIEAIKFAIMPTNEKLIFDQLCIIDEKEEVL